MRATEPRNADISERLTKAMRSEVRIQILEHLKYNPSSPAELSHVLDQSVQNLSYHFGVLRDFGCIRPVEDPQLDCGRSKMMSTRHESVIEMLLTTSAWAALDLPTKMVVTQAGLDSAFKKAHEAIVGKTMESRIDRHLSVVTHPIDEQAWEDFAPEVEALFKRFYLAAKESEMRARDRDERFLATLTIQFYESPEIKSRAK